MEKEQGLEEAKASLWNWSGHQTCKSINGGLHSHPCWLLKRWLLPTYAQKEASMIMHSPYNFFFFPWKMTKELTGIPVFVSYSSVTVRWWLLCIPSTKPTKNTFWLTMLEERLIYLCSLPIENNITKILLYREVVRNMKQKM